MTAYQDELKRSLPKLGCEGVFDYEYDTLSIQYNGYVLGFQNSNGNLNYSRDLLNTAIPFLLQQGQEIKDLCSVHGLKTKSITL